MTAGPVLAIDVGTSSVRVAVITPDATVLDLVRSDRVGADPGHAFDAETLWSSIVVAVAALDARARSSCTVVSVAAHLGTVLLDPRLRAVGPASGWSDPRGTSALAAAFGDDTAALLRATGRPVVSAGPLAALLDARRDPGRGVSLAVSPKDFVVARLSAERPAEVVTDTTSAAYTGALDVRSRSWSSAVLDRVDVDPACLGRVVEPLDVVGELRDDVARAMGLPVRLPVVGGGPDGTIGLTLLLGTIDTRVPTGDGPIGDVAGTTDVLAVRRDTFPDVGPAAVVNPFPLGGWTVGGPTGTTGGAVAHWARVLGFPDTAAALSALGAEVGRIPPGSAGLTAEVALSGRRFPHWDSGPGAGLSGMTDAHGPAHVLRAVIEGGARAVADAVAAMPVGADTPLVLAGGAARSLAVVRIRADVLGRRVMACDEPDMTLKGAALVGVLGTGGTEERDGVLTTFTPSGTIVDPGRCTPLDQDRKPSVAVSWQPNTANPSSPMRLPASNTTARTT